MGVEIREVLTKKELWSWVRFPNKLYKDIQNSCGRIECPYLSKTP